MANNTRLTKIGCYYGGETPVWWCVIVFMFIGFFHSPMYCSRWLYPPCYANVKFELLVCFNDGLDLD